MSVAIINKVAESGILTIDLDSYYPREPIKKFDLKDFLFMNLILKEKDYRAALTEINWEEYKGSNVFLICSTDAIIPMWAFMLAAQYLQPFANNIVFGDEQDLIKEILLHNIEQIKVEEYLDKRVVIKGCGETPIPEAAYVKITALLRPVAKSIMYGEPCSTVPIFKKAKV